MPRSHIVFTQVAIVRTSWKTVKCHNFDTDMDTMHLSVIFRNGFKSLIKRDKIKVSRYKY